jgi:hypothetical protein
MAGLLAGRVLAEHFEQVTVVDRDRFPDGPKFRTGVPHARHFHVLLGRGLESLERLVPGFEADLVAVGAPIVEGSETLWLNAAGWSRRYRSPIRLLGASRKASIPPSRVSWRAGLVWVPSRPGERGPAIPDADGKTRRASPCAAYTRRALRASPVSCLVAGVDR